MTKLNCWEFNKCGREPKGENAHTLGICPAAVFDESDGFCDGKNGGRACMYIAGTFCSEIIRGTRRVVSKACNSCNFYNMIKEEHGSKISVFSFREYVKERNNDFTEIIGHDIYNVRPLIGKGLIEADNKLRNDNFNNIWLHLLVLVDYSNHAVKQGEWYKEDREYFYRLKDSVMEKLYRQSPPGATVNLQKVHYSINLNNYKEKNNSLTLHKRFPLDFGYSPEPEFDSTNTTVRETVLIEMEVTHAGKTFCFHIPAEKANEWGLDVTTLSSKKWIPSREFNRQFFKEIFEEIRMTVNFISRLEADNVEFPKR